MLTSVVGQTHLLVLNAAIKTPRASVSTSPVRAAHPHAGEQSSIRPIDKLEKPKIEKVEIDHARTAVGVKKFPARADVIWGLALRPPTWLAGAVRFASVGVTNRSAEFFNEVPLSLQSEAGYNDARPRSQQIDENLLRRTAGPYIGVNRAVFFASTPRSGDPRKLTVRAHRANRQPWARFGHRAPSPLTAAYPQIASVPGGCC